MLSRINAADLHQRVGEILSKIRYSGERFVIERRGIPVAAVVSIQDLERLQTEVPPQERSLEEKLAALKRAEAVRKLILKERHGKLLPDSAKTIRELRAMRDRRLLRKRRRAKANLR